MLYDLDYLGFGWTSVYVPMLTQNHLKSCLVMTTETSVNCFHGEKRWPSIQPSVLVRMFIIHNRKLNSLCHHGLLVDQHVFCTNMKPRTVCQSLCWTLRSAFSLDPHKLCRSLHCVYYAEEEAKTPGQARRNSPRLMENQLLSSLFQYFQQGI